MQIVRSLGLPAQLRFHVLDRSAIEEIPELLLPEELAQQVAVERERLRAPLGRRRVVLVHVRGDVVEEERGRVGRGGRRLHVDDVDLPRAEALEQPLQRGQVEDVLEALAVGLEHDRERRVAPRDLEQRLGPQPLLPQRSARARPAPRDQQGAGGVLAEARAEQRGLPDLLHDEVVELVGVDEQLLGRRRRIGVRQVERDPVVRPDRLHLEPERVAQSGADRHRPRGVHARAERGEDADAPVADLVAEALDHDCPVGGHGSRRRLLLAQEREQVACGALVEAVPLGQPLDRLLVGEGGELPRGLADLLAELVRPPHPLALPERHRAGNTGGRRDEHAVARDLLDPPRRGAEQEGLPRARLVHHLLVELADAPAAVDEMDAEEAAVGDRARVRDREPPRAVPPANHAGRPVPDDPRLAARRTRRRGSDRRACRARSRAGRARGRRTGRRRGRGRAARRPRSPRRRRSRRSAGRARRAGCAGSRSPRSRRRACARRRPPTRAGRRGTWGRCAPSRRPRARGRHARSAAARARPTSGSRPG